MLSDMGMRSYVGVPLLNDDNETIGILVLLHSQAFEPSEQMMEVIKIFASRAAAEILRSRSEQKLRRMAYYDYVTRLPNRALLFERINAVFDRNQQSAGRALMLLLDLDRFTEVNQHYGYDIGELVLREVGARLDSYAADDVFVASAGGDEFAVIITDVTANPTSVMKVHWQALRAVIRMPVFVGKREIHIDCSAGAVVFPEQTPTRFDVIRFAETALRQSKDEGRGRALMFDPHLQASLDRSRELEVKLFQALSDTHQLALAYQPKVNQQGEWQGLEALMRWQHPVDGFISPGEFIPVAEDTGLIHALGEWLIRQVCRQLLQWDKQGLCLPGRVAINVSASQFARDGFISVLQELLQEHGITPSQIEIEVTESGLLHDRNQAIDKLKQLRAAGFSVALDDFGTGYSSLSYLRELPLDVLKIDKAFVDNVHEESSRELVRAIISIGRCMKLDVVAEGTETAAQVEMLSTLGCELFQGYFFSKPLSPEALAAWASARLED